MSDLNSPKNPWTPNNTSKQSEVLNIAKNRAWAVLSASSTDLEDRKKDHYAQIIHEHLSKKTWFELSNAIVNSLYEMLSHRGEVILSKKSIADIMADLKLQQNWYAKRRENIEQFLLRMEPQFKWVSNPVWFGIDVHPELIKTVESNYKMYTTLPVNQYWFIHRIPLLIKRLRIVARNTNDSIKVKIPTNLSSFIAVNDSIVVHFGNPENQVLIAQTLDQWMKENGITESPREFQRTKFAADDNSGSFTAIVSENVTNWMLGYRGTYSDDVLVREAIQHAIDLSSKPPRTTKNNPPSP